MRWCSEINSVLSCLCARWECVDSVEGTAGLELSMTRLRLLGPWLQGKQVTKVLLGEGMCAGLRSELLEKSKSGVLGHPT